MGNRGRRRGASSGRQSLGVLLSLLLLALNAQADRTALKPGMNFFSPQQDVEFGRQAAQDAEKQLPMLTSCQVDTYLNALGQRLAAKAPGYRYPYQFKAVNQKEINAFALPGGPIYVNRGTIDAAKDEAELAGVMAHEISHVALRHGTNQLSKAVLAQAPLAILGGVLGGGGSVAGQLAALGIQVGFSSVFLKFSRTDETQADVMGTQILYDAGYNPHAMADFFKTLEKMSKGSTIEFFSSHPNPEHREERILEEIHKLGDPKGGKTDSEDFHVVQTCLAKLPPPPKSGKGSQAQGQGQEQSIRRPELPSSRLRGYQHSDFSVSYPENWQVHESGTEVVLAPPGGAGGNAVAYGMIANVLDIEDSRVTLEQATDRLVQQMVDSNAGTRVVSRSRARLGGERALAVQLSGPSPLANEREIDWLFTVRRPDGLFYAVFIVPESDYRDYQSTFQKMLDSLRFR